MAPTFVHVTPDMVTRVWDSGILSACYGVNNNDVSSCVKLVFNNNNAEGTAQRFIVTPDYEFYVAKFHDKSSPDLRFLFLTRNGGESFELVVQEPEDDGTSPYVVSSTLNYCDNMGPFYLPYEGAMCVLSYIDNQFKYWVMDYSVPVPEAMVLDTFGNTREYDDASALM
jgi:hypothetical protein